MMISISIGTVGIRVSGISVVGISMSITISMSMSITISMSMSITEGMSISMVGISYSMTITMTISMAIISTKTMAISIPMVAIVGTGISTGFSLPGSSGEQTEGNNSNGFHHFECLQARVFS